MNADELRALADRADTMSGMLSGFDIADLEKLAMLARTLADLQEPARKARANWRRQRPTIRAALTRELGDALAAIVERMLEATDG